jgi:chitodextrinase
VVPVPDGISATAETHAAIRLAWSPPAGGAVDRYDVFRGEERISTTEATEFRDKDLRHTTRYCYSLRSVDAAGNRSLPSAPACAQTLVPRPPSMPGSFEVAVQPGNKVSLSWQESRGDLGVSFYNILRDEKRIASAKTVSASDAGLKTLGEYCYQVVAIDPAGNRSPPAGPVCVKIPDTTPPTVPEGLEAKAPGEQEVTLTWEPATDDVAVTRYDVTRAEKVVVAAAEPRATDRGLVAATQYCYTVRACDAAGNCSASSRVACAVTPDLTPPSAPAKLTARAPPGKGIELEWEAAIDNVGVTRYEVARGTETVARLGPVTTWGEEGLRAAREYCYTVIAADQAGNRSRPSPRACTTVPDVTPPSIPGNGGATPVSTSRMFLSWSASTDDVGVTGYEVLRDGKLVTRVSGTRARETGLQTATEYCYTVVAFDGAGNRSAPTPPLCGRTTDGTAPGAPENLEVRQVSAGNVMLKWEPSEKTGALYRIYGSGGKSIGLTKDRLFSMTGAVFGPHRCFVVSAVDEKGRESTKTPEVCAEEADPRR